MTQADLVGGFRTEEAAGALQAGGRFLALLRVTEHGEKHARVAEIVGEFNPGNRDAAHGGVFQLGRNDFTEHLPEQLRHPCRTLVVHVSKFPTDDPTLPDGRLLPKTAKFS